MSRYGQTTLSGGVRSTAIYDGKAAMRRVTGLPTGSLQLNTIGFWCWESITALQNNCKGAVYTTGGIKIVETNILGTSANSTDLLGPITSNSSSTPVLIEVPFPAATIITSTGTLDVAVAATGFAGTPIIHGDNDTAGLPVGITADGLYPTFPSDYAGIVDITTPRQWDIFIDATQVSTGSPLLLSLLQDINGAPYL
jgi:hypothetical protein